MNHAFLDDMRPVSFLQRYFVNNDSALRNLQPGTPHAARQPGNIIFKGLTGFKQCTVEQCILAGADGALAPIGRDQQAEFAVTHILAEVLFLIARLEPVMLGCSLICRKCTASAADGLNSLCCIPLPALMRCTSPGRIVTHAVLVFEQPGEYIADDLHVTVGVGGELSSRCNCIIINHA